jgi:hypothetical protein
MIPSSVEFVVKLKVALSRLKLSKIGYQIRPGNPTATPVKSETLKPDPGSLGEDVLLPLNNGPPR